MKSFKNFIWNANGYSVRVVLQDKHGSDDMWSIIWSEIRLKANLKLDVALNEAREWVRRKLE
jgi:hypothetical protein